MGCSLTIVGRDHPHWRHNGRCPVTATVDFRPSRVHHGVYLPPQGASPHIAASRAKCSPRHVATRHAHRGKAQRGNYEHHTAQVQKLPEERGGSPRSTKLRPPVLVLLHTLYARTNTANNYWLFSQVLCPPRRGCSEKGVEIDALLQSCWAIRPVRNLEASLMDKSAPLPPIPLLAPACLDRQKTVI